MSEWIVTQKAGFDAIPPGNRSPAIRFRVNRLITSVTVGHNKNALAYLLGNGVSA